MNKKDLQTLSDNTRIDTSRIDNELLISQVSEMMGYLERINSLPLDNVKPFEVPLINQIQLREDIECPSYPIKEILLNAPDVSGDSIVVPRII